MLAHGYSSEEYVYVAILHIVSRSIHFCGTFCWRMHRKWEPGGYLALHRCVPVGMCSSHGDIFSGDLAALGWVLKGG